MRLFRLISVFVLLSTACAFAAGSTPKILPDAADAPHLRVQLVTPEDAIYPSGNNAVGLYFKLEPGWHVYWKNAGDSGEPPHIKWTLPDGVRRRADAVSRASRLPLGPLMDFGYEDEVLFPLKLEVAPTVTEGKALLHAKVDWLVCREVCIPGKASSRRCFRCCPRRRPRILDRRWTRT